jgi:hypothetical protein
LQPREPFAHPVVDNNTGAPASLYAGPHRRGRLVVIRPSKHRLDGLGYAE